MTAKSIIGRLAPRSWRAGDPLPAIGSLCLVSGAHSDVESDQHRSYLWRKVVGFSDCGGFVCLQTEGCWPTVERTENCWFGEIPVARDAAQLLTKPGADEFVLEFERWNAETGALPRGGSWMAEVSSIIQRAAQSGQLAGDYEEVLADHRRLVRELDVHLNGEAGAAKQASLCDIVAQVKRKGIRAGQRAGVAEDACSYCNGKGWRDEGDPEIGSAIMDCHHCFGTGSATVHKHEEAIRAHFEHGDAGLATAPTQQRDGGEDSRG